MGNDSVTLAAVGDIMLGDRPLMVGFGVRSCIEASDSYDPFEGVRDFLNTHDLVFGNLESIISDCDLEEEDYRSIQMRGPCKSIELIRKSGFNLLSVANNHMMQHGVGGFNETVHLLKENEIEPLGCINQKGKVLAVFKEVKGRKFGFMGFSLRPERYAFEARYARYEFEEILQEVRDIKSQCDFLIVSLHWGDEYISRPSQKQIRQARLLADEGVSLIVGHHPHVVQGVERYNNSVIAYSLGNFIFDVRQKRLRQTVILVVEFKGKNEIEFKRIPACMDTMFRPHIQYGTEAESIHQEFEKLDSMIHRPHFGSVYRYSVKLHEIRNKIANRILFLKQLKAYKPWVLRQSLFNFMEDRIK